MAERLPFFPEQPANDYTITLDGVQYQVFLTYSSRRASWYLTLLDENGATLVSGRRLSPGFSPLPGRLVGGPPGSLSAEGSDPYARAEVFLRYVDLAELQGGT